MSTILVGNVIRSTVTFAPESGTVSGVTCQVRRADGAESTATPTNVSTNVYRADVEIADDATPGVVTFRWKSTDPKISIEDTIEVTGSGLASP